MVRTVFGRDYVYSVFTWPGLILFCFARLQSAFNFGIVARLQMRCSNGACAISEFAFEHHHDQTTVGNVVAVGFGN